MIHKDSDEEYVYCIGHPKPLRVSSIFRSDKQKRQSDPRAKERKLRVLEFARKAELKQELFVTTVR